MISQQWMDEIKKHVKTNLKILFYTGGTKVVSKGKNKNEIEATSFIQPQDLAKLDVCITTYEVLANELSHIFGFQSMRSFRAPKRYMKSPSPLTWYFIFINKYIKFTYRFHK